MPLVPLMLSLSAAALSGGGGGVLAWTVTNQLKKFKLIS
jgi:hypothetical protein